MSKRPPLPDAWVERLFARLTVVYGHAFLGRWSGLDMAAVKASWAEELSGFSAHPEALQLGLESLPAGEPPTVLQFRDLCRPALREERQAPPLALDAPKADPKKVAALVAAVDRSVAAKPKAWAWALKAREEGEKAHQPDSRHRLTPSQREAWRTALRSELEQGMVAA